MMKRRILSVLLAVSMVLIFLPVTAAAESPASQNGGTVIDDWEYTPDDDAGTVTLTRYIGDASVVTVPGSFMIDDRSYAAVLASQTVFRGNTSVTSVTLESGVGFSDQSMRLLFGECSSLTDADFSAVDTSGVTNMSYIFYKCPSLKTWTFPSVDTEAVTTIRGMFSGCTGLTQVDLSALKTPAVTDMAFMFYDCGSLKSLDLSSFDTSRVVTIRSMFSLCTHLSGLTGYENWNTSSVEEMYQTFNRVAYALSANTQVCIDLSRWDLSHVTNTGWCFQMCRAQQILVPDNIAVMSAGFMNHAIRYAGTTYTVPSGVKKIGYAHTFYDFATNDFTEFIVDEDNENYQAIDGVLYSADGTEMLAVPRNKPFDDGIFEIPEGVTFLAELSFSRNYNIHTVVLPDTYEIEYVPVNDERYIVYNDTGNLNAGTNLSVAIYCYTGITDYAVKESNPRYAGNNGVIYSKDMTRLVAVPARYNQTLVIPEGVTCWDREALWADGSDTVDNLLQNCPGVQIPASVTSIADDQLEMINRLHTKRANGNHPFTITIDPDNTAYHLDEQGLLQPAVSITTQPADAEAALGETVRTQVVAEGEGLTYQWYGRDPGQKNFWKSGVKKAAYSVKMVREKIGREVYCEITDSYGNTARTRTAVLGVTYPDDYTPPAVVSQPETVYADAGERASVSFTASGEELTYQWYGKDPGQEKFWKSGLTGTTYAITMCPEKSGREVYCVITDKYGNTAATDTVSLNMLIPDGYELKITRQPQTAYADVGEKASVSVAAEGSGLRYQWFIRNAGKESWSRSSIKSAVYEVEMNKSRDGRELYCVVTDKYGNSVTSEHAFLHYDYPDGYELKITSQPSDASARIGKTVRTSVTAVGDGLIYQWYGKDPGQQKFWKSSVTGASYSYRMTAEKNGRQVYCVVTDRYGNRVTGNTVTLSAAE